MVVVEVDHVMMKDLAVELNAVKRVAHPQHRGTVRPSLAPLEESGKKERSLKDNPAIFRLFPPVSPYTPPPLP